LVIGIVLFILSVTSGLAQDETPEYRVVGYYTYYSIYDEEYYVTDIPGDLLTHLNYAHIDVSPNGQCVSSDPWADMQYPYPGDRNNERLRGNFKQLQLLREDFPNLKILMSIGGWEHSTNLSDAALTQDSRIRLARSCIAFMRQYQFDGIDLDWRYPVSGGAEDTIARPEDRQNFTLLLAELRGQLDYWSERDNRHYLLTVAAPAIEPLYRNLELDQLPLYVDWINLTAYGYEGEWSTRAGHFAPLFPNSRDPRGTSFSRSYSVDGAVNAYLDAGVPASQIVLGVPFYAQTWRNVIPNDYFGLFQPTDGVPSGTRPGGILFYRDLAPLLASSDFVRFFDDESRVPWMYNEESRIAVSYEDEESILSKAAYVRRMGLGGMMVWVLSQDDETHTLLRAVYTGLNGL
jgi:chitinase